MFYKNSLPKEVISENVTLTAVLRKKISSVKIILQKNASQIADEQFFR